MAALDGEPGCIATPFTGHRRTVVTLILHVSKI